MWALSFALNSMTMPEPLILTVSALNQRTRRLLENHFEFVWIRGELSNYRRPRSGHWYFTLKDDQAQVRCAMFVNRNRLCRMQPVDGAEVLLRGRVSLYEGRGEFQVIVEHMAPAGEGALRAAFEALKERLAAEGLFAAQRKRSLPAYPRHLAVVSSASGAALRDVLSVVARRFPLMRVTVLPTAVQGAEATAQILAALARIGAQPPGLAPDVALLTRGGGSLEDFAPFNAEETARAIAACPVPIVSAIGHETDFTIADFVADLRAPTPSAAAELITPDGAALAAQLAAERQRLTRAATLRLQMCKHQFTSLRARLINPQQRLQQLMQRADDLDERLQRGWARQLKDAHSQWDGLRRRMRQLHPRQRIAAQAAQVDELLLQARRLMATKLQQEAEGVRALARTLQAAGPFSALARGYAFVTRAGSPLTRAEQVRPGDRVEVNFHDGLIEATSQGRQPLPNKWREHLTGKTQESEQGQPLTSSPFAGAPEAAPSGETPPAGQRQASPRPTTQTDKPQ